LPLFTAGIFPPTPRAGEKKVKPNGLNPIPRGVNAPLPRKNSFSQKTPKSRGVPPQGKIFEGD